MQSSKSSVFDKCQYADCNSNTRDGVRLFRFPGIQDPRQLIWVKHTGNLRLKGWTPSSIRRAGLCAKHFRPEDLMENSKGRMKLRRGCYPISWEETQETGKKVNENCLQMQECKEELSIQREEQIKTYPSMRHLWIKKIDEEEDTEFINADIPVSNEYEEKHQIKVEMREEEINVEHKDEEPVMKKKYVYIIETNSPKTLEIGKKEEKTKSEVIRQNKINKQNTEAKRDEEIRNSEGNSENEENNKNEANGINQGNEINEKTGINPEKGLNEESAANQESEINEENGTSEEHGMNAESRKSEEIEENEEYGEREREEKIQLQDIMEKPVVKKKKYIYIIYKRRKDCQDFEIA